MRTHWLHNRRLTVVFITSLCGPVAGHADDHDRPHDRALFGLQMFAVHTDGFRPEYRRLGIDGTLLDERIRGRLRGAGLPLANESEVLSDPRGALLRLSLKIVSAVYLDSHYYDVSLQVIQSQPLPQGGRAAVPRTIWARHIDGHTSELQLKHVSERVMALIDGFIAAYRQQNPAP